MRLPIRLMVVPARMKPLASHHSHNAMEPVWFRLSTFANGLTNNKDGFTSLLAVIAPNLMVKPPTIMFNKVTTKDAKQAVQMFGPAQHAVAKAVADSVAEGVILGIRPTTSSSVLASSFIGMQPTTERYKITIIVPPRKRLHALSVVIQRLPRSSRNAT
jgi:hypothetical protein